MIMRKFTTFIKGIILGFVGLAVPGLSASTVALEVGIYQHMINALSNLFKKFKSSALFLGVLMLGYFTGGFIGSVAVESIYKTAPLVMILLVIGLLIGGMPHMAKSLKPGAKKVSDWIVLAVVVVFLIIFSFILTGGKEISFENMKVTDYIMLFFVGIITSTTLVVPGVDFAVLLISLGYYNAFTGVISNIFDFSQIVHNLLILGTYIIGYGIGAFVFSKLIKKIIDKFSDQTTFASFGFVLVAPVIVIKKGIIDNPDFRYSTFDIIFGAILGISSMLIMIYFLYVFDKKKKIKEQKEKKEQEQKENVNA